jgi:hypothetical protein
MSGSSPTSGSRHLGVFTLAAAGTTVRFVPVDSPGVGRNRRSLKLEPRRRRDVTLVFRLVVGVVLVVVGLHEVRKGWHRYRLYRLVRGTPTTSLEDLTAEGLVELTGEVVGDGDRTTPPVGDEECVLAAWMVEEYQETARSGTYRTVAVGLESVPFRLDDGTGEVVVDFGTHADDDTTVRSMADEVPTDGLATGDVVCEFESFGPVTTVEADEEPPASVREFRESTGAVPTDLARGDAGMVASGQVGDRRYSQALVRPGDKVYLLGYATSDDETAFEGPTWTVGRPPEDLEDAVAVVSTMGQSGTAARIERSVLALPAGIVVTVVGLLVLGYPYVPFL